MTLLFYFIFILSFQFMFSLLCLVQFISFYVSFSLCYFLFRIVLQNMDHLIHIILGPFLFWHSYFISSFLYSVLYLLSTFSYTNTRLPCRTTLQGCFSYPSSYSISLHVLSFLPYLLHSYM